MFFDRFLNSLELGIVNADNFLIFDDYEFPAMVAYQFILVRKEVIQIRALEDCS